MRRILITSRNDRFPSLADGNRGPVHSQDHKPVECSAAGATPGLRKGAGRAPLHLASMRDEELATYARQLGDSASALEIELAGRILNLLDELEDRTNTYNGDDE